MDGLHQSDTRNLRGQYQPPPHMTIALESQVAELTAISQQHHGALEVLRELVVVQQRQIEELRERVKRLDEILAQRVDL